MEKDKLILYPFQKIIIDEITELYSAKTYKSYYNACAVGLGKTITTIECLNRLNKDNHNILCITTGSTRTNWNKEFIQYGGDKNVLVIYKGKHIDKLSGSYNVVVISYKLICNPLIIKKVLDWKYKYIIFDEAQVVKNKDAKVTSICYALATKANFTFPLSATPIKNSLADLYMYLYYNKPKLVGNYYSYLNKFCKQKRNSYSPSGITYYDGKNLDEFRLLLQPIYRRYNKEQVLDAMPKLTYSKLWLKGDAKIIKQMDKLYDTETKKIFKQDGSVIQAKEPANLAEIRRLSYQSKKEELLEFITNLLDQDESILLIAYFRSTIADLKESLKEYDPLVIQGGTDASKIQPIVDVFNSGQRKLLVGQIITAGVGLNIQTICSTIIFVETSYCADDVTQACGRIHRIGQTKPCIAYLPMTEGTVDDDIYSILRRKAKLNRALNG